MKRLRSMPIYFLVLFASVAIAAAEPAQVVLDRATKTAIPDSLGELALAPAKPRLDVLAGKDEKRAVISVGRTTGNGTLWSAKLSSPWDDEKSQGLPATLDGLSNGVKLEVSASRLLFKPPRFDVSEGEAVCADVQVALGESAASQCDERLYDRVTDRQLRSRIAETYFGSRPLYLWSIAAAVASDNFKTLNLALEEDSTRKTMSAFGVDFGAVLPSYLTSVVVGYRLQNGYESDKATQATICQPVPDSTALKCKQGFFGPPKSADKSVLSIDVRHQFGSALAMTFKASRDFEEDVTGLDLPIYILRSKEGAFSGGIRFGWRSDTHDVVGGIFVTTDFSLLP
jgi:hypothetical protein